MEILNSCLTEEGLQILIGSESNFTQIHNFSIVARRYGTHAAPLGMVGIIGPMRMEYARMAPLVDYLGRRPQPQDRRGTGATAVMTKTTDDANDDAYVIEDTGESSKTSSTRWKPPRRKPSRPAAPSPRGATQRREPSFRDRYLRTLADFENFRKRAEREKADFFSATPSAGR